MPTSVLRILSIIILATASANAQTFSTSDLTRADEMLERVYETIFARAGVFVDIACFIGAMGAMVMISTHIYGRMIRGKALHLSALARPILILFALILYTPLVETVNIALSPTLEASKAMVNGERDVLNSVLDEMMANDVSSGQHAAYAGGRMGGGDFDAYLQAYGLEDESDWFGTERIGQYLSWQIESFMYQVRWGIRMLLFWVLGFVYTAVVFCLSAIRTFTLAVLALVGPLSLGFSLWSPFSRSFITWLGRYIAVYLWLPVANIFGFLIATIMTEFNLVHLEAVKAGGSNVAFSSLDIMYAIMLVTGIIGYIAVPSITAYIINASGASSLLSGAAGAGKAAAAATGGAVVTGAAAAYKYAANGYSNRVNSYGGGSDSKSSSDNGPRIPRIPTGRPSRDS